MLLPRPRRAVIRRSARPRGGHLPAPRRSAPRRAARPTGAGKPVSDRSRPAGHRAATTGAEPSSTIMHQPRQRQAVDGAEPAPSTLAVGLTFRILQAGKRRTADGAVPGQDVERPAPFGPQDLEAFGDPTVERYRRGDEPSVPYSRFPSQIWKNVNPEGRYGPRPRMSLGATSRVGYSAAAFCGPSQAAKSASARRERRLLPLHALQFLAPAWSVASIGREKAKIDVHRLECLRVGTTGDMGDQRPQRGCRRRRLRPRGPAARPPRTGRRAGRPAALFHIALDAGHLAGESAAEASPSSAGTDRGSFGLFRKVLGRWQPAQPGELGVLQTGDHAEDALLLAVLQLGLETDHVVERAERRLSWRSWTTAWGRRPCARVGQADRLHRAEAQRLDSARRHHLDRQAALEIGGSCSQLLELGLRGVQERPR